KPFALAACRAGRFSRRSRLWQFRERPYQPEREDNTYGRKRRFPYNLSWQTNYGLRPTRDLRLCGQAEEFLARGAEGVPLAIRCECANSPTGAGVQDQAARPLGEIGRVDHGRRSAFRVCGTVAAAAG